MFHGTETIGGIHVPYNWLYADATEREGADPADFVAADVGKLARQEDDNSLWMLTAVTPTWSAIGSSGGVTADNVIAANSLVIGNAGDRGVKAVAGLTTDGISRLQLGVIGGVVGGVEFRNATTGTVSLVPVTGALGTAILSLPAVTGTLAVIDSQTFTTYVGLPSAPTTAAAGRIGFSAAAWAASRGAIQVYDGTANTVVVAALSSSTPANGKVPTWNTGGTITWETPSSGGDMLLGTAQTVTAAKTFNAGTLKIASGGDLVDANGNELFKFTATASAINELTVSNAATGGVPGFVASSSSDTNISIGIAPAGTGSLFIYPNGTAISTFGGYAPTFQVHSNTNNPGLFIATHNASGAEFGAQIDLLRGRGTGASPTVVSSGDSLGNIDFLGRITGGYAQSTRIRSSASETFGTTWGGTIEFWTTLTGASTWAERARISGIGNVLIGTTSDTGLTGAGNLKILTDLMFATTGKALRDANGNELLIFTATASAVNEITLANGAAGTGPTLSMTGGDTDIDLNVATKANGGMNLNGPTRPLLTLLKNGSGTAQMGTASGTNSIIAGSATDEWCFRSIASKRILFSTDNGTTFGLVVETGGDGISVVGATRPILTLYKGTSGTGQIGTASGTDSIVAGSTTDDFCFRSNASKSFLWSVDNGTSAAMKLSSAGVFSVATTTEATSATAASAIFAGGVGINKKLFVTGIATFNGAELVLNAGSGTAQIQMQLATVAKGYYGIAGSTDALVPGSASGDTVIRTQGGKLLLTTDSGSTIAATFAGSTGIPTFGKAEMILNAASGTAQFVLNLAGTAKAYHAVAGGTDSLVVGSVSGDTVIRTQGGALLMTTDSGTSIGFQLVGSNGGVKTSTPNGGTSGAWKFGIRVAATVAPDTTQYIQLDVGGTLYKVGLVT